MEAPSARESRESLGRQRKLVAENCPAADTSNVWLVQLLVVPA
jgi:hypothetical protein